MPSSEIFSPGWVGCGKTALVVVDDSLGQGEGSPADSVVREFIGNGGTDYLLEIVSGLGEDALELEAMDRIMGEDGGPGERTGLYELAGSGEVGTLVLPSVNSAAIPLLERFALRHPQVLLCCEISSDREDAGLLRPLPNLALLRGGSVDGQGAAALAGQLCARDFFPLRTPTSIERPGLGLCAVAGMEENSLFSRSALRSLTSWRRWQGLYRSLDDGSRWAVFELASKAMARRLERELRAFLHSLVIDGFLPFRNGFELEVKLQGSKLAGRDVPERRLSVEVRTSLDPGTGVSVERVIDPSRSNLELEGTVA